MICDDWNPICQCCTGTNEQKFFFSHAGHVTEFPNFSCITTYWRRHKPGDGAVCGKRLWAEFQIQISNSKKVYCHKYIDIHNIYIQVYSDNEGNEANAYLSLYGEWDQLITLVMAYSLSYKLSTTRVVLLNRYTHMCPDIVLKIEHKYRWLVSRPCHLRSFCSTDAKVYARTLILI